MLSKNCHTYQVKPALQANTVSIIAMLWCVRAPMANIAYNFERMLTLVCSLYKAITVHTYIQAKQ